MPLEELLVKQMTDMIVEINNEGLQKKIDLSKNIIALLYVYMRRLGLSEKEIIALFNNSKGDTDNV